MGKQDPATNWTFTPLLNHVGNLVSDVESASALVSWSMSNPDTSVTQAEFTPSLVWNIEDRLVQNLFKAQIRLGDLESVLRVT